LFQDWFTVKLHEKEIDKFTKLRGLGWNSWSGCSTFGQSVALTPFLMPNSTTTCP